MNKINWGIIGCGDVTELKSGPAFNKVPNSSLVAVMRRNAEKAADYARRHQVPKWYNDANQLINDPDVNAVYIATPPDSHEAYTIAAIKAGKPVYVEKPMALNFTAAQHMLDTAVKYNQKLVVAHYRREWPLFKKLKQLIVEKVIGEIEQVDLAYNKPVLTVEELADEKIGWRVNPLISGGGLFHDLAPHQLDIMYHLFGTAKKITGYAENLGGKYQAPDMITGNIIFDDGLAFNGIWNFNATVADDHCDITGSNGQIRFCFFNGNNIAITIDGKSEIINFKNLQHVQQPMIEKTVKYFIGKAENPCPGDEGALIMQWIEKITGE